MSAATDHYRTLHVQPDAPAAIIHASYRTLVQRALASDRSSDEIALLDAAYAVLGDPQRRAAYDLVRLSGGSASSSHDTAEQSVAAGTRSCLFCGTLHTLDRALERDDECGQCASPLYPAERQRFEYSGQRMLRRIAKRHPIAIFVTPQTTAIAGEMRNLSLNGMSFASPGRFELNQVVLIECSELRALARVAHVERDTHNGFTAGVEFLTLRFRQVRGTFVSAEV
jgi:hypothetical protein